MKKLIFIFLFIFTLISCQSKEGLKEKDKKVLNSFILKNEQEIIFTFGKSFSLISLNSTFRSETYSFIYCRENWIKNTKSKRPVIFSTSKKDYELFNYFDTIEFIIKDGVCIEWSAFVWR
jgi:hypothetical protein